MIVFNDPKKGANFCESFNRDIYHIENEELLYSGFGFVLFFLMTEGGEWVKWI